MGNKFSPLSILVVGKPGDVKTFKFKYIGSGYPVRNKENIKYTTSCGCIAKVRWENGYVIADMTITPKKGKAGTPHRVNRSITVYFMEDGKVNEHLLQLRADIQ